MKKVLGWVVLGLAVFLLFSCTTDYARLFNNQGALLAEEDQFYFRIRNGRIAPGMEFQDYSGINTIWVLNSPNESWITCSYDLQIDKGRFKVILISPAGEIFNIVETSESGIRTINLLPGESRIRIAGSRTTGNIEFYLETGPGIEEQRSSRFEVN